MNLTTGTGKIAWQPQRLSAEAYALDTTNISETLPSSDRSLNVLEGVFPYGPIGVCRTGGTCVLSKMPAGWADNPYPRLIRFKLQSEHGTGYVYSAIVKEARKDGRRALVDLMSVQDKYAQGSLYTGSPLVYPGLTLGGRTLGVAQPSVPPSTVREQAWQDTLAPFLNSEWGVGPDLFGVAGYPGGAPGSLEYTRDYRAGNPVSQGFVIPDYATEWIFDPGEGWEKTRSSRGAPTWAPERVVSASADPATITATEQIPFQSYINTINADGVTRTYHSSSGYSPTLYEATPPASGPAGRLTTLRVRVPYSMTRVEGAGDYPPVEIDAEVYLEPAGLGIRKIFQLFVKPNQLGLVLSLELEVPSDLVQQITKISLEIGAKFAADTVDLSVGPVQFIAEVERPNVAGIVIPREFSYPYFAGPTYQFDLPAWVAPPVRVLNLPGGPQYLAQSEVHWTSKGATSVLTTAAMPWR